MCIMKFEIQTRDAEILIQLFSPSPKTIYILQKTGLIICNLVIAGCYITEVLMNFPSTNPS